MSINKVILVGRLGQEPELKYTPSGTAVCNFSLATSENWTDRNGQKQDRTEWHRVVVWGKLGELCNQYLGKGRQAYVEGKLQTRSWEDKSGSKRYTTEINATNVLFLGSSQGLERSAGQQQNNFDQQQSNGGSFDEDYEVTTDANFTSDDIPF